MTRRPGEDSHPAMRVGRTPTPERVFVLQTGPAGVGRISTVNDETRSKQ